MIFLNTDKFIAEAIESVIAQTYEHWELLLVDDGSTDSSREIVRTYEQNNAYNIRCFQHPDGQNRGMSASRNLALKSAQGEYVMFLDSDDLWLADALAVYIGLMRQFPAAAMVYGDTEYWLSWASVDAEQGVDYCDNVTTLVGKPNSLIDPPEFVTLLLSKGGAAPCMCSLIVRREALQAIGNFENNFRDLYEDQVMYVKISLSNPVYSAPVCLAKYRQRPDSSCAVSQQLSQDGQKRILFLEWLESYSGSLAISNRDFQKALAKALNQYRRPLWHQIDETLGKVKRRTLRYSDRIKTLLR